MAQRGRKPLLPSPDAPGPEVVPTIIREIGTCADGTMIDVFDAAMNGARIDEARKICADCPAREMCQRYAIGNEPLGIWGGMTPGERAEIRLTTLLHTPEERRDAEELRIELGSGRLHEHIAAERGVSSRTLARWIVRDTASHESAA